MATEKDVMLKGTHDWEAEDNTAQSTDLIITVEEGVGGTTSFEGFTFGLTIVNDKWSFSVDGLEAAVVYEGPDETDDDYARGTYTFHSEYLFDVYPAGPLQITGPKLQKPEAEVVEVTEDGFKLEWDEVDDADEYNVYLYDNPDYENPIYEGSTPENEYEFGDLDSGGGYWWRVEAGDSDEEFETSDPDDGEVKILYKPVGRTRIELTEDGELIAQKDHVPDDLGEDIDSYVIYPPRRTGGDELTIGILTRMWIVMDENSSDIKFEVMSGDNFQSVLDGKGRTIEGRTRGGGRQQIVRRRLRAPVVTFKLIGDRDPWAVETILVEARISGRQK